MPLIVHKRASMKLRTPLYWYIYSLFDLVTWVYISYLFFFCMADEKEEPRILGLAMVPGKHIVSIEVDEEWHLLSLSIKISTRRGVTAYNWEPECGTGLGNAVFKYVTSSFVDICTIHVSSGTFFNNTEPTARWDGLLSKDYFKRQTTVSLVIAKQAMCEWWCSQICLKFPVFLQCNCTEITWYFCMTR